MTKYDLVVAGGTAMLPDGSGVDADIAVRDGRIAAIGDRLGREAEQVVDATGMLVVPGAVDAHFHLGVYRPLADDASSETRSAASGGVTTIFSYFRTGSNYMNRTGSYRELLPTLLDEVEGRSYVDVGFHLAPMTREHIGEMDWLVTEGGVTSFKYYMYMKGLDLTGGSSDGASYAMTDEYDLGHLYAILEQITELNERSEARVSLSLHCENAELIKFFRERYHAAEIPPLEKYSRSRPAVSERVSVHEVGVLADETGARINLLHLSSADALRASLELRQLYPSLDVRLETTAHHLCLTYEELEGSGTLGKCNPPLRSERDRDALWDALRRGDLDWVASDHACCNETQKGPLWEAVPGYGGSSLLYPALITEGHFRRGVPLARIVEVLSEAPARAFSCFPRKGALEVGSDADIAVLDLTSEREVQPELLHSSQDFTPFAGRKLRGWATTTVLRGNVIFADGEAQGGPRGQLLVRQAGGSAG